MILSESELSHRAAEESLPLRDAFSVLFFVSVGMLFDPSILVREPLLVLATVLIIVVGKSLAAWLIVRAFGHPNSTALTISASLAQIGEFSFILATRPVAGPALADGARPDPGRCHPVDPDQPLLFSLLDRYEARHAEPADVQDAATVDLQDHVVLVGYGRVGRGIGEQLRAQGGLRGDRGAARASGGVAPRWRAGAVWQCGPERTAQSGCWSAHAGCWWRFRKSSKPGR
jgi:CPA2 family monovalent cation:H+ antiporter-2